MEALKIRNASAMPAPTWSWLRMNAATLEVPEGLERVRAVTVEADSDLTETHASFEGALAALQERLDAARGDEGDGRACVRAATAAAESLEDLDTPALSAYQLRATREEVAGDVAAAFETGIGVDARSYLNFLAGGTVVLATEPGADEAACVRVAGEAGGAAAASVDVVAAEDSTLSLTVSLDGAGAWTKFWRIALPLLSPAIFYVLIVSLINAFQLFPQIMIMTDGGPNGSTQVMVERIYKYGFRYYRMGYAAAFSWLLFVIIMACTGLQMKLQKRWVNYDA